MALQRILWLNGPESEFWELPLQENLLLLTPSHSCAPDLLLALRAFWAGDGFQSRWFPQADTYLLLELKVKKTLSCVVAWRQGSEIFLRLVRTGFELAWFQDQAGQTLSPENWLAGLQKRALQSSPTLLQGESYRSWFRGEQPRFGLPEFWAHTDTWLQLETVSDLQPLKHLLVQLLPQTTTPLDLKALRKILQPMMEDQADLEAYQRLADLRQHIAQDYEEIQRLEIAAEALATTALVPPKPQPSAPDQTQSRRQLEKELSLLKGKLAFARERQQAYAAFDMERLLAEEAAAAPGNEAAVLPLLQEMEAVLQLAQTTDMGPLFLLLQHLVETSQQISLPRQQQEEVKQLDQLLAWEKKQLELTFSLQELTEKREQLQKDRDTALEQIQQARSEAQDDFEKEKLFLQTQQKQLQAQQSQYRQSLMAWLRHNYPDWEQSFGKILREDVLLNPYLSPQIDRINELLFGVKVDLSELDRPDYLEQDFTQAAQQIETTLAQLSHEWIQKEQRFQNQYSQAEKRWRQKLRENQRDLQKIRYERDHAQNRVRKLRSQLQGPDKSHALQQAHLRLQYRLEEIRKNALALRDSQQAFSSTLQSHWQRLQESWPPQEEAPKSSARKKGANPPTSTIPPFQGLLAQYRYEQLLLFHWIPSWEAQIAQKEVETALLQQDHTASDLAAAESSFQTLSQQQTEITTALANCKQTLWQNCIRFAGAFHPDNQFQFPAQIQTEAEAIVFAEQLVRFAEEDRFTDVQEAISTRHAERLMQVAEQIPSTQALQVALRSPLKKLEQEVRQIWGPFCSFALQPAAHPLPEILAQIQVFAHSTGHTLGSPSLFQSVEKESSNPKAWSLLNQCYQAVLHYPTDTLSVTDCFRLEITLLPGNVGKLPADHLSDSLPQRFAQPLRLALQVAILSLLAPQTPDSLVPMILLQTQALDPPLLLRLLAKCETMGQKCALSGSLAIAGLPSFHIYGLMEGEEGRSQLQTLRRPAQ